MRNEVAIQYGEDEMNLIVFYTEGRCIRSEDHYSPAEYNDPTLHWVENEFGQVVTETALKMFSERDLINEYRLTVDRAQDMIDLGYEFHDEEE